MAARLRDLVRAAKKSGLSVEKPSTGSHWKFVGADGKRYPVPAHNGERSMIVDAYIRGLCNCFGLDEAEFRHLL